MTTVDTVGTPATTTEERRQAPAGREGPDVERRKYPRSESFYPVRIHVEQLGAQPILTHGILLNLSLGGALLSVEGYLPRDQPCQVEIFGASGRVIPHRIFSRVVETSIGPRDDFRMRVEFAQPLEAIKRPEEV